MRREVATVAASPEGVRPPRRAAPSKARPPRGAGSDTQCATVGVNGFAAGPPQGETRPLGGQRPHAVGSVGAILYCQLPTSASLPSPPDCPSAPNDITSISPLMPGFRYW
ncbi:MAG: hypothetical protein EON50_02915 [Acidovorax sp.]|nr:MAG: hypothetical protein EON50_02915 [Acidovorax sp.]